MEASAQATESAATGGLDSSAVAELLHEKPREFLASSPRTGRVRLARPRANRVQLFAKECVDLVAATFGLIVLAPLLTCIAMAIKIDSPGPVLFSQERAGRNGRRFKILKFRTMVPGAEALRGELLAQNIYRDPRLFKVVKDPRTTRLGRILRKSSLDELPQLMNVLRGEMSLVGPRPPLPDEVAHYGIRDMLRLTAKPGITGPWQVAGRNEITDFGTVVELELKYLQNWSLLKDIGILAATIPAVLNTRGAH